MTVSIFMELVEMKAKSASIFPFLLGSLYAWYHYEQLSPLNLVLFFIAMLTFNMAVDANDNYQDYKNAKAGHDYKQKTNIIGVNNLNPSAIGWLVFWMILLSAILGVYVATQTGWPVLWMGLFSYAVGYFYAAGPRPISTTPFGEFFSGITMGFVIFLLAVYINVSQVESFDWSFVWPILISSGLGVCAIADLMLANNTCDAEEDRLNGRHTLVFYLGQKKAVRLFAILYMIGYICLIVAVFLGFLPKLTLLTLLTIPIVYKNTVAYTKKQIKKETFINAVKNLFILTLSQVLSLALGVVFHI